MILDATDLIMGRLATKAAKLALLGEQVTIVNCEKAVLTGDRRKIIEKYLNRRNRGEPFHGPFYPRMPDRLVRRCVRGMLPYKMPRGKDAFKRVKCFIGVPSNLQAEKAETLPEANISKAPTLKFIKVEELSREMGAKV